MSKIPKLKPYKDDAVKCTICGISYNRFCNKDGTDMLGMECPECRLKERLRKREAPG